MKIINEKTDFLLDVKSKYTYRIFENGGGGITFEVQLSDDFKRATLKNFALAATTRENFERVLTVDYINKVFKFLRDGIQYDGRYATIESNDLPRWDYLKPKGGVALGHNRNKAPAR